MAFYVYILRCSDGSYYTGHTDDVEKRLAEHNAGTTGGYTVSRRPVQLIFCQEFPTRDEAFAAERKIKGWSRKKKEAMIRGDWDEVSRLARSGEKMVGGPFVLRQAQDERPSTSSG
ncbi:MAG: GIY-YIG nuclease family protein [Desulfobulbaceae bacterium]